VKAFTIVSRSEYAHQLRIGLLEALNTGKPDVCCDKCGEVFELEDLEVDHPDGRTWYGRNLNFLDRVRRQWRECDAGIALRKLCRKCNASDDTLRFRGRARYA